MNNKNQLSTTAAADGLQLGSGLRRIVCLAALLALSIVGARADVDIYDEQIFPDANFRDWLLAQDYGYDGYISDDELMYVEYMDVSSCGIASLKGIEFFTALTELDCYGNQLTELDVSKNTALTTLNCGGNPLTELDVSKNTELTYLYCYITQVSALDLSNNTKLISLSCDRNKLSALDLSNNKLLNTVACSGNRIRGAAMTALVNSLPDTGGILYVYNSIGTDGNVMTPGQVAAALGKGWTPMMRDEDENWVDYPGFSGIAINDTNFPDETFRRYVSNFDTDEDGTLSIEEIDAVTSIDVSYKPITNLDGIEIFTALTYLDCRYNDLTSLNVSKNTALTLLDCSDNQLTELNVSKNTALKQLECSDNQLTSFDVSKNTALNYLDCGYNQLTALDVSKNIALKTLYCNGNDGITTLNCSNLQLTGLYVSSNKSMTTLDCSGNQIDGLNLSDCSAINKVYCYNNQLWGSGMARLLETLPSTGGLLYIYGDEGTEGNEITPLQVQAANAKGWQVLTKDGSPYAGCDPGIAIDETTFPDDVFRAYVKDRFDKMEDGYLTEREIAEADYIYVGKDVVNLKGIELFTALERFTVSGNNFLTLIDLSGFTALNTFGCHNTENLSSLNLSGCTSLEYFYCQRNKKLSAIDLSGFTNLYYVTCQNNEQLESLNLSGCTALKQLYCDGNKQLTSLDASGCTAFETFITYNNDQLTTIKLSGSCSTLTSLYIYNNAVESLDLSGFTKLEDLYCYDNQLTSLDLSKNTALTGLFCYNNQLTTLDVSGCTTLRNLTCYSNQLTTLDVSKNKALTDLYCYNNQLTSLDVSNNNTVLYNLDCFQNLIRGKSMTDLVNSLPDRKSSFEGSLRVYYNEPPAGNLMTPKQIEIATSKNWKVLINAGGAYDWVPYEGETVPGDANGDGEVNAQDVDCLRDYILGRDPQPFSFESANLNGDSEVDIQDLTQLIQLLTE